MSEAFGKKATFFFPPDVLRSSQQLLSNPDDCGALPTSNWHRFGSAQTWGYLWHHSHFIFSLSVFLSLPVFAFALCKHQRGGERVTRPGPKLFSPPAGFRHSAGFCVSLPAVALAPRCGFQSLSPLVCLFPPQRDCFAGDFTAVINDLGAPPGGKRRGAVRKHNKLVISFQTSLLLTAPVF